jgi:DNA invertase Pin-like site-specific DNA recombinase
MNNVVCYARVSTITQDLDIQINEIKKFCDYRNYKIYRFYSDKKSGKDMDRPDFKEMMNLIETNTVGVSAVIIYKLDRIGRSLSDLIKIVEFLKSKNVQLISICDNLDTSSDQGTLFFQIIGAIAEYERKLIVERTSTGRKEALKNGVKFGRPEKIINRDVWNKINRDISLGIPKSKIIKKYGLKRSTFYKKWNETLEVGEEG